MEENREVRYQITPKFNLLYEMGMPTGKKIKTSLFVLVIFVILTIIVALKAGTLSFANHEIFNNIKFDKLLLVLCIAADIITIVKLVGTIIFQKLQYKHVTYTFYDDMMIYEDDFLNQHRKNIEYKNIKEVEIRRTIWDRMLNYGIMVIYTNADNDRNNGLVIYSVKDPKTHYNVIDKLIHKKDSTSVKLSNESSVSNNYNQSTAKNIIANSSLQCQVNIQAEINEENSVNNVDNIEQEFKDSLKNINE